MASPESELQSGHRAREQGRLEDAMSCYRIVVEAGEPETAPEAELFMAIIRQAQGKVDEALGHYDRAISSAPSRPAVLARYNVAKLNEGQGRFDEAIDGYKAVTESEPVHPWATPWAAYNAGVLLVEEKQSLQPGKAYLDRAAGLAEECNNTEVLERAREALGMLAD